MIDLAIIGSGPSALGVLAGIMESKSKSDIRTIHIFDKLHLMGSGMPFSPQTTDPQHLFNFELGNIGIVKRGDFTKYMLKNRENIVKFYQQFFQQRLEDKLARKPRSPEAEAELRARYERIFESFRQRYLNFSTPKDFVSRISFGIYANQLFEESVAQLRKQGIEVVLHPATEVKNVTPKDETMMVEFGDKTLEVDKVVLATGLQFAKGDISAPNYIPAVWPVSQFCEQLEDIIEAEIARRRKTGSKDKIIKLAIQGRGLTAIDVLKSIFGEAVFKYDNDGKLIFEPADLDGFEIHVEMLGRHDLVDQSPNRQPITTLADLARTRKVHVVDVMLLNSFTIMKGYSDEGHKKFLQFLIAHLSPVPLSAEEIEAKLASPSFAELVSSLDVGRANYQEILREFTKNPGFSKETSFMASVLSHYYCVEEEMRFKESEEVDQLLQIYTYISQNSNLPAQSVEEMVALAEAGVLRVRSVGAKPKPARLEEGKIIIETTKGEILQYDGAINARGLEMDFKNPSTSLMAHLLGEGVINWSKTTASQKAGRIFNLYHNDVNIAFDSGKKLVESFFPTATIAPSTVEKAARGSCCSIA